MEQTKKLIHALETRYGNGHLGLASQVGYLTGVIKSLELEYKSCGKLIAEHAEHVKKGNK